MTNTPRFVVARAETIRYSSAVPEMRTTVGRSIMSLILALFCVQMQKTALKIRQQANRGRLEKKGLMAIRPVRSR